MVSIRAGRLRGMGGVVVSVGRVALVASLAGCSYVPDALNPVEWYKGASDLITGGDRPEVASPRPPQGQQFPDVNASPKTAEDKKPADTLAGDASHAHYAAPLRREVAPTKTLVRRPAPVQEPQVAATPAAPAPAVTPVATTPAAPAPAPVVQAAPAPAPAAQTVATMVSPNAEVQRQAIARAELGPSAPPAKAPDMTPPARPDIPDTVAASTGTTSSAKPRRLRPIDEEYQRRLTESASTVVRPPVEMPQPAAAPAATLTSAEGPVHLRPPSGGGHGKLAAPQPAGSSFQVAALDFAEANASLTAQDRRELADIAKLYRKTGGTVRILGHSPAGFPASDQDIGMARADAVAAELVRRGVPADRIMIADAPMPLGGAPGAQVFLDY